MAITHGKSKTSTYYTWQAFKDRCRNPRNKRYKHYGARGIMYDPTWENFTCFLEDMGERPEGMSLDRIENNGNYSKENCRWATLDEQSNNRTNSISITREGRTQTLTQWAKELGLDPILVLTRKNKYKWPGERLLEKENWKRRSKVSIGGETLGIQEWSKRSGIKLTTIIMRINKYGWPVEKAIFTPVVRGKMKNR